ncbi:MAG: hypothetical protein ABH812_01060 [bacterium]
MKRVFFLFLFLIGLVFIVVLNAKAATTAAVTATVTAQSVSITLTSDGAVAFLTIGTSATKDTTTAGVDDSETAQNNGNVTEDISIKAANSTSSGAGWTLGGTAGSETYTMKSCIATCDTTPTWTAVGIDPSYVTLVAGVAASGTQVFDLQVGTPTSTTDYNQQTITVTLQAAAS